MTLKTTLFCFLCCFHYFFLGKGFNFFDTKNLGVSEMV